MKAGWMFWTAALALCAALAAAAIGSAAQESQTFDESTHLGAGYAQLVLGETRLNVEHPPLAKLLSAAAVLPLGPRMERTGKGWEPLDENIVGKEFLYRSGVAPDRLLTRGRLPTIALAMALVLAVAVWTRRFFGVGAGLFAAFLCAFDPNVIAHGRYVTNDLHLTLFLFLACMSWSAWLEGDRLRDLAGAALWTGLALVSKFSAVILAPVLGALYVVAWVRNPGQFPVRRMGRAAAVLAGTAAVVLMLAYLPASARSSGGALRYVTAPFAMWAHGFAAYWEHNAAGQPAYLMGKLSDTGWWYFFPVVFAVKTPTAVLVLLAVGAVMALRRVHARAAFAWWAVTIPLLAYGAAVLTSNINLGVRHLLPVYPFLFALLAGIVFRLRSPLTVAIVAVVVLLEAVESMRVYPHYLAFFNTPSGGPANGAAWLVDSSLDWGQDLRKLRTWWDASGHPKLCLRYFGAPDPSEFGFRWETLPETNDLATRAETDCIGAVSATLLKDVYVPPGAYQWLRDRQPIGNIGYSIYLYDLRKPKQP